MLNFDSNMVEFTQTPELRDAYYSYEEIAIIFGTFIWRQFSKEYDKGSHEVCLSLYFVRTAVENKYI